MWVAVTSSCWFFFFFYILSGLQHRRRGSTAGSSGTVIGWKLTTVTPSPSSHQLHHHCMAAVAPWLSQQTQNPNLGNRFSSHLPCGPPQHEGLPSWKNVSVCEFERSWSLLTPKASSGGSGLWPLATLLGLPECCHSLGATWPMVSLRASEQGHRMQLVLQSGLEWFKFLFLLSSYTVASTKELSQQHYSINAMNPELLSWYVVIFCRQNKIC